MTSNSLFTLESVLAAAFSEHDFIGHIGDQEITIRTIEPFIEEEHTLVEVDAITNPMKEGVTYRYRVRQCRVPRYHELRSSA